MLRVKIEVDYFGMGEKVELIKEYKITNEGPTSRAAALCQYYHDERSYKCHDGEKGVIVTHRRRDGAEALVSKVLYELGKIK